MKILYVLPRNMHFGTNGATSIDLCCRDLIAFSEFRDSTQILTSPSDDHFSDFDIRFFSASADRSTRARAVFAASLAKETRPDLIVVQQHLPSAAAIARRVDLPVILHRHNFQKPFTANWLTGRIRRKLKLRSYASLAGMIHVSQACYAQFSEDWPEVTIPRATVPNGLAVSHWCPERERVREILCVGRSAPEKGILETAQAIAALLQELPDWRGRFILSSPNVHPQYHAEVLVALAPVADRVSIDIQVPYSEVRAACERAAIAVVASKWDEPFGRTALEAHAGGVALISSGSGGLREVSGDCALYLDAIETGAIASAVRRLIEEPELRAALAQAGRERAEQLYTTSKVSAQADAFFKLIRDRWQSELGAPKSKSWVPQRGNNRHFVPGGHSPSVSG